MNASTEAVDNTHAQMRSIIGRIATGPELSKDISLEEARFGMSALLNGEVDPVQGTIFLIALRMKRETDDENRGVLDAIRDATIRATAEVDDVLDLADPYDGYNRTVPSSPFLPAVLAACGVPTVTHGLESVGPKYGATHRTILRAAGINVDVSPQQAAASLSDAEAGWAYVDQARFCPKLHDLIDFRTTMVKRPAITTVEVMAGPVVGRKRTHLLTGYVHKPYPRIYAMLARHAGYDSSLLVRGTEGGVVPSLRQTGKFFSYREMGPESDFDVDPKALGIEQELRSLPLPEDVPEVIAGPANELTLKDMNVASKLAAEYGLDALAGKPGGTRDGLVFTGGVTLWHMGKADSAEDGAAKIREALDSGRALAHFNAVKA
ncbi:MAG: anthranilate phosphoribosyltransferase [Gammaproteobacteria bacterium]